MELNGVLAGEEYDQINVGGTVNLSGLLTATVDGLSAAFWVSDGNTKCPGSNPSSRKTKPSLRAVNEESQQS